MVRVPLDPFEFGEHLQRLPLLDLGEDGLYKILVLHGFPSGGLPAVFAPVDVPQRDAVNGIFAIGDDLAVAISGHNLQCSEDSSKLGSLVGLPRAGKGFGDVSMPISVASFSVFRRFDSGFRVPQVARAKVDANARECTFFAIA